MANDIQPFKIAVSDEFLADLKTRLNLTRYPHELTLPKGEEWSYGTPVSPLKDLVEYWRTEFDWRKQEKTINEKLPQFTVSIDTGDKDQGILNVHFAHVRSSRPHAVPLLISHGWPGNFFETIKVIDELTEPADPKHPAFHVVAPSIPGFGFSDPPRAPGFGVKATANVFDKLMTKLGYEHYVAQGGDWGGSITRALAVFHSEHCRGMLTNLTVIDPTLLVWHPLKALKLVLGLLGLPGGYPAIDMQGMQRTIEFTKAAEYMKILAATPQSLGVAMTDSPAGLLAWFLDKYHGWTDNYPWTKDELLTWTMMYYIPGPSPSFRYYKENKLDGKDVTELSRLWSDVPLGVAVLKEESITFPHDFGNLIGPLKYSKRHDHGGHWSAWEVPEIFLADVRAFFGPVILEDPLLHAA